MSADYEMLSCELQQKLDKIEEENKKLKEGLEFYAYFKNSTADKKGITISTVDNPHGELARQILKEIDSPKEE